MRADLPKTMKALVLHDYKQGIQSCRVEERALPTLGPGDVLIKISAAPIHPSDLMFIQGLYGFKKAIPVVPGFEGSGRVVATGARLMSRFLMGRRVACTAPTTGDGTWAQYMKAPALTCLPLPKSITDEQGAMMVVNPFTAYALIELARKTGRKAFVQTAAGSQLGQMIWRLAQSFGLEVISIVRREEQRNELLAQGMATVLCSSEPKFEEKLREVSHRLKANLAFDAVSGDMTSTLLKVLPKSSQVVVYGGLSLQDPKVSVHSLIFDHMKLEGFWLSEWLKEKKLISLMKIWKEVRNRIGQELGSEVRATHTLDEAPQALREYAQKMSGGKILIRP